MIQEATEDLRLNHSLWNSTGTEYLINQIWGLNFMKKNPNFQQTSEK